MDTEAALSTQPVLLLMMGRYNSHTLMFISLGSVRFLFDFFSKDSKSDSKYIYIGTEYFYLK